ncbi:MAG: neutral/alkaline non-lysosomal ceramidase N-terminal domain-containing protein [Planctomycetota bacterium]
MTKRTSAMWLVALTMVASAWTPLGLRSACADLKRTPPKQEIPKAFPGNKPEVIKPDDRGVFVLPASKCEVYGQTLEYMQEDRALGYWNSVSDHAVWVLDGIRPGDYEVWMEWSCAFSSAGTTYALHFGDSKLTGKIPSTGTWQKHKKAKFGILHLGEDHGRLDLRSVGKIREALADVREIQLLPVAKGDASDANHATPVGVAKIDITPEFPVMLSGYGNRQEEFTEVEQKLWARALAIGEGPKLAVILTVDNLGVPSTMTDEVANRLAKAVGMNPSRLAVCSSHTHTGPYLKGVAPTLFGRDMPIEFAAHVDHYTAWLTDKMEEAARKAIEDRKPSRLSWNQGKVEFAANRRLVLRGKAVGMGVSNQAPVDHSLPLLRVTDLNGKIRAVYLTYACHCTTLDGNFNKVCGDWLGFAVEGIERELPGATALISIGCGADANPKPRGSLDFAKQHGEAMAREAARLLSEPAEPLPGEIVISESRFSLPFASLPTLEQWRAWSTEPGHRGHYARVNLEKLKTGEKQATELPYRVQTWRFGDRLTMVHLAGEVVVDYALALKQLFGPKIWVIAYANDVPCYIPSARILAEGGYEADDSMIYYNRPARFDPKCESIILGELKQLLPRSVASRSPTPIR